MRFDPKSAEEVKSQKIYPDGFYDFEIVKAEDKVSKAGNDMIKIIMKVFNDAGDYIMLSDYLLSDEAMAFKLRHCCEAIGILPKYESGDLVAGDFETGVGRLKLKVQKSKDPQYPDDRNSVADYLTPKNDEEKKTLEKSHGVKTEKKGKKLDDSIPFSFVIGACLALLMVS